MNHKRVQRLWREEGLQRPAPRKRKRARPADGSVRRHRAQHPHEVWAMDFQFDATSDGRRLKLLNVIDEHSRLCLATRVGRRCKAKDVVAVLEDLSSLYPAPVFIHRSGAVAPVAMGVLVQLGVTDPVPALNAPAIPHQLQQGFWGGAQAGEEEMGLPEDLAVASANGGHLHDPAGAAPGLTDVLRCLFGTQSPGDVAPVALLVIHCETRDVAFPLELAADLTVQSLLVALHGQQEVGPLLLELLKNGRWVWSASAWISTPSRSSSPSSCFSTARSWFAPVA